MNLLDYVDEINKVLLKYQNKCNRAGVADEKWYICDSNESEIKIIIPAINTDIPAIIITTNNDKNTVHVTFYDDEVTDPFEVTTTPCTGKTNYNNVIKALNDSATWIISNML